MSLDGVQLKLETGQTVVEHGIDRSLTVEEIAERAAHHVTDNSGVIESPWKRRQSGETPAIAKGSQMPSLLSVNVGMPQNVDWQGRTVFTSVWKNAVQGPRMVRRLNVDGDGQGDLAGHGGEHRAVFVYQIDSYHYWQRELGRDDFTPGQFGENFTIDGLSDEAVCIGDRYRIGKALFEVSQPRVTCYRVGIRMNEPRMAALLVAHNRPGFYFRVVEEGEVEAGDEIVQVATGQERMSVSEVNALLYKPGHSHDQLERALRIPSLSAGWRASFQALLTQDQNGGTTGNAGLAPASTPPAWAGFRHLRVSGKVRESRDVVSLELAPTDGLPLAAASPGQFVVLRLTRTPDTPAIMRSYSLSAEPNVEAIASASSRSRTAWQAPTSTRPLKLVTCWM